MGQLSEFRKLLAEAEVEVERPGNLGGWRVRLGLPDAFDLGGREYRVVREEDGGALVADGGGVRYLLRIGEPVAGVVVLDPRRLVRLG